jgi:hypothetical protein
MRREEWGKLTMALAWKDLREGLAFPQKVDMVKCKISNSNGF